MASAKREAMNRLGSEDDYIGLSAFNKEREAAKKSYDTGISSLQNEYNNMLKTMANNRASTQKDFSKGRASVRENSFMNTRNDLADLASRGISGGGLQQLSKLGNRMETGRQYSDLANTYYNTMNEIANTERQGTDSYNINREIASNNLATQLAGIGTREANARNNYRQAVANLAEQIQARRDANANAARAYALQKAAQDKEIEDATTKALFDRLKAIIGKGNKADNYISARDEYKNLVKNATDKDAIDFMKKYSLYDSKSSYDKFKRDIFGSSKVAPAKAVVKKAVKKKNTGKTYSSLFGNSNGMNRSYESIPTLGRR